MERIFLFFSTSAWQKYLLAFIIFVLGYFVAKKLSLFVAHTLKKRLTAHQSALVRKFIFYLTFLVFAISALNELGFKLTVLLGAAGVFTVALSFASQTAASNLISGLFLIIERPFRVGDEIGVGANRGVVEALDLLSTKIKTSDHRLIRIPNESLIRSDIVNYSIYSHKRDEIILYLPAITPIDAIKNALEDKIKLNPHLLPSPEPKILFSQLTAYAEIELRILYWTKSDLSLVKDELLTQIQQVLASQQIELSARTLLA